MVFIVFKSGVWSLLTLISLIRCFISTTAAEPIAAVSPVLNCELDNDTYICTGAQYHMYCNTTMNHFYFQRYGNQNQYQCISNDCICVGNKDTCACYYNTSSCFCDIFSNNITVPTAVRPVYDCVLYNDLYICTGAQYHMYCNTSVHDFHYYRYHYHCMNDNCDCIGDGDTCTCYSSTSSSCFCTDYNSSITIPAAVSPVYDCVLYNDIYICTGAQYRMYCNTKINFFFYQRYGNQNQYHCSSNNCNCIGNKDTCTCSRSTLSSCFCISSNNPNTIPAAVSPVTDPDCVLHNDIYICTGAQYRMYCNTEMHDFSYQRYQNQFQYQCVNNNCNCIGNKDTCTCSRSTLSSCFCETYGNSIALTTAVIPVYNCVLYDTLYICTGAQYQMYCKTTMHEFNYQRYRNQNQYQIQCWNNNCYCTGNNDTCTCSSSTLSSCFCKTYGNSIALTSAISPAYGCELYNGIYICTGFQYRMYCKTKVHDFYYRKYQSQKQYQYQCMNNNCNCVGNKDTCTCSRSTFSSCFCETYSNNITIPTAVNPLRVSQCVLFNDTYICTGAQYRLFCNTRMHDFYYQRSRNQNQDQYQCVNNNCNCIGNKDTCSCSSSTLSSCFCETYGNSVALTTAVRPANGCVLYNNTAYICTGAQYRMYCNTSVHDFHYDRYHYHCVNNNCNCNGNKDTCSCSRSTLSSCFCETYGNSVALTTAVSPVTDPDCVLHNDTYICTGAQYRMYCNTSVHDFHYYRYHYHCLNNNCDCIGNEDTCTCYSSTLSSCFCESNIFPTTLSPTTAVVNITLPDQYMSQTSRGYLQNLLEQIENITDKELPLYTVMNILTVTFNAAEKIFGESSSTNLNELAFYGNRMLNTSEKLISTLVKPTVTSDNVSFTLPAVEVNIFMVGPQVTLDKIPQLDTTNYSVDIDLIGIAKNNNERSAAVAFMSYNMMETLLKPDFFNTSNDMIKIMMSTVISATLPKTTNTTLTKPVNFTFRHIREFDSSGSLSCVYWNISEWIVDGCSVLKTNSSFTVCSCVHLSTFALIQTSGRPPKMDLVILLCVIVGLVFFSLALLTFALYKWSPARDWMRGCIVHGPEGYNREELRCSTRSASDAVDSKPTTSKVSQKTTRNTSC